MQGLFFRPLWYPRSTAAAVKAKNSPPDCFLNAFTDSQRDNHILSLSTAFAFCKGCFFDHCGILAAQLTFKQKNYTLTTTNTQAFNSTTISHLIQGFATIRNSVPTVLHKFIAITDKMCYYKYVYILTG